MPRGVDTEQPDFAARGLQQVQQTLDGGGLAGAVPAEEAVAAPRADLQIEAVHRVGTAVPADQAGGFDDGIALMAHAHALSARVRLSWNASNRSSASLRKSTFSI